MKKLFTILILFPLMYINAQENDSIKSAEKVIVTKAAVLPVFEGCEPFVEKGGSLAQCFNNNILRQISTLITPFEMPADVSKYKVMISFVVSDTGNLEFQKIRGEGQSSKGIVSFSELDENAKNAFQALAEKVNSGEITIQPAKDKDGKAVNVAYSLPINFN